MKHFYIGIFIALNCCTATFASDLPVSRQEETTPYQTLDQAAEAALSIAMPVSEQSNTEYGGIIVELDGQFFYTSAVTTSEATAVNFKALFKHGAKMVGLYHTHPGNLDCSNYFSAPDVELATKLHVVSYIGVTGVNNIRRFIPNQTPTYKVIEAMHERISNGVVIS